MATELATAYVSLVPSFKGGAAAISKELGGPVAVAGGKAADGFGKKFSSGLVSYGKVAGAGLAGAAVGLFKVGETFHEVEKTIRVGTGATGEALDGLVGTAKNVGTQVPSSFGDVSTAVADLNTRLGLTGKPLEDMAGQFLNVSRITGTDLSTNIEKVTRVFGDWDIATEDQAGTLDMLFRASQATGVGIDQLSSNVVKFGAPMRQLGFSFEETTALLGKFEKEGVNTELVMGSMRIALGKMAREGEEPVETLARVTDQIKNAGDAGEANALALELFGARAGPDMAAAIREGRFEVDDLVDVIANGSDTINAASKDTEGFTEKWQLFKNRAMVAIEPIATRVFDIIGDGMDWIGRNQGVLIALAAIVGTLLVASFAAWAVTVIAATWPILAVIAAIGLLVAGFLWVRDNLDTLKKVWESVWDRVKKVAGSVWDWISRNVIDKAVQAFQWVRDRATWLKDGVVRAWDAIKDGIGKVWDWIKRNVVQPWVDRFNWVRDKAVQFKDRVVDTFVKAREGIGRAWDWIKKNVIQPWVDRFQWVRDKMTEVKDGILKTFRSLRDSLGRIFEAAIDKIKSPIRSAFTWINDNLIKNLNKVTGKFGLTIPLLPKLHTGGVVPGRGEVPAMLLGGEGVVSPRGMRAIGGKRGLDAINSGLASGGPLDWVRNNLVDPVARAVGAIGSQIGDWLRRGAAFALDKIMGVVIGASGAMPAGFSRDMIVGVLKDLRPMVKAWGEGKDALTDDTAPGSMSPASIAASGWARPIGPGYRIGRGSAAHGYPALDLPAPTGTAIYAAADGLVTQSLNSNVSYGNRVMVAHSVGRGVYAHMSTRLVPKGAFVRAGQVIGRVGSTGNSTGPHLHLELGRQDPLSFLRSRGVKFDRGGTLQPGWNPVFNGTGGPETLRRVGIAHEDLGRPIVVEIRGDGSKRADFLVTELQHAVRVRGGDVQTVLGRGGR